jgi:hypothetical protein
MMKLTDDVKNLRAEVAVLAHGRGRKYPAELRTRILAWVDREVARGTSESECGEALGMPMHRFELWRQSHREREKDKAPATLVPVEVTAGPVTTGLVVATPDGYRIEGLTFAEAIAVLEALR